MTFYTEPFVIIPTLFLYFYIFVRTGYLYGEQAPILYLFSSFPMVNIYCLARLSGFKRFAAVNIGFGSLYGIAVVLISEYILSFGVFGENIVYGLQGVWMLGVGGAGVWFMISWPIILYYFARSHKLSPWPAIIVYIIFTFYLPLGYALSLFTFIVSYEKELWLTKSENQS